MSAHQDRVCLAVGWPGVMGEVEGYAACLIHNNLKGWKKCDAR